MMIQILRGLAHVHRRIVHRDIKPGNILIAQTMSPNWLTSALPASPTPPWMPPRLGPSWAPSTIWRQNSISRPKPQVRKQTSIPVAEPSTMLTGCDPVNLAVDSYQSGLFEPLPKPIVPILHEACSARSETRFQTANDFIAALEAGTA